MGSRRTTAANGARLVAGVVSAMDASSARVKPVQNAFAESFIGRLRDELLNETLFRHCRTHALFLRSGVPITTPNDLTRGWAG